MKCSSLLNSQDKLPMTGPRWHVLPESNGIILQPHRDWVLVGCRLASLEQEVGQGLVGIEQLMIAGD